MARVRKGEEAYSMFRNSTAATVLVYLISISLAFFAGQWMRDCSGATVSMGLLRRPAAPCVCDMVAGDTSAAALLSKSAGTAAATAASCADCEPKDCPQVERQECPECAAAADCPEQEACPLPPFKLVADLLTTVDKELSDRVNQAAGEAAYSKCRSDPQPAAAKAAAKMSGTNDTLKDGQEVEWKNMGGIPCKVKLSDDQACCQHMIGVRTQSTDMGVVDQIWNMHWLRQLYILYKHSAPKYILDAGANVGISATFFKYLFPDATVVSLEPDPGNFAGLKRNTQLLDKVHIVNAGLWSHSCNITLSGDQGDWAKIFREAKPGEGGMAAYSVQDVANMFNIPAFDYVKVDIEGAEGPLFGPGIDVSWVQQAKLVSVEPHDRFAGLFGLGPEEISQRIFATFKDTGYKVTADNEHLFYISPALLDEFNAGKAADGGEAAAEAAPAGDDSSKPFDIMTVADPELSARVNEAASAAPYSRCHSDAQTAAEDKVAKMEGTTEGLKDGQKLEWKNMGGIPCKDREAADNACCHHLLSFRSDSTDYGVVDQIWNMHWLRQLYVLFKDTQPKYILDAGANVGISAVFFKYLFPDATVVSLEPDDDNFAALKRNTQLLDKVHIVNAGLWGHAANITLSGDEGDWAKIFREAKEGEEGMPAVSIQGVAKMFDIPAFDYIKIDVEGAEGIVFAPESDISWIQQAKLVSVEPHDRFAGHFGLGPEDISLRIQAAFNTSGYSVTSDNEHLFFISPPLLKEFETNYPSK